ncbi:hypothetical protein, partial [Aeromonas sobria]|uniref:hypothetical protein n=1 Tax=Aeromonas sobria TaxID=646 RepID=UPI0019D50B73
CPLKPMFAHQSEHKSPVSRAGVVIFSMKTVNAWHLPAGIGLKNLSSPPFCIYIPAFLGRFTTI